jgi:hypothetical protein
MTKRELMCKSCTVLVRYRPLSEKSWYSKEKHRLTEFKAETRSRVQAEAELAVVCGKRRGSCHGGKSFSLRYRLLFPYQYIHSLELARINHRKLQLSK